MSVLILTLWISSQIIAIPSLFYSQHDDVNDQTNIKRLSRRQLDTLNMRQKNADYDWPTYVRGLLAIKQFQK